ncbi:flagellar assembly protein FliW [Paenibacillus sp. GCM10027627]|uniref:flagellar assembly protein FliW n=1 Tax=unclassified Paenibacillus TaxID=185978 RepID=UPI003634C579
MDFVVDTLSGKHEYKPEDIISFQSGIPGFKDQKSFIVVEIEESPFKYLQSTDLAELSFVIVSPFDFFPEYEFDLSDDMRANLHIEDEADLLVFNIVSIRDELSSATVNLSAPLIINTKNRLGVQYILDNGTYSIRQPLFSSLLEARRG